MAETIDVLEAARRLGVTPDAIRARLRRGTLEGYRDNAGNWRIVSNDKTVNAIADTALKPARHDTDTMQHDVVSPDMARLLKALLERIEADQTRLIEERDAARAEAQDVRADADRAKAEQVRMALEFSEKYAELHADRARLQAELEGARVRIVDLHSQSTQARKEAEDAQAHSRNLAEQFERVHRDHQTELEHERRSWWQRVFGRRS
jgi:hypothetical protein